MVRLNFAKTHALHSSGACSIKFGIAGGGIHQKQAEEFEIEIGPLGGDETHFITATGIRKPYFNIQLINEDVSKRHRQASKEKIYVEGGEVDLSIGLDYAPLIVPGSLQRASSSPDSSPSIAFTRLGSDMVA